MYYLPGREIIISCFITATFMFTFWLMQAIKAHPLGTDFFLVSPTAWGLPFYINKAQQQTSSIIFSYCCTESNWCCQTCQSQTGSVLTQQSAASQHYRDMMQSAERRPAGLPRFMFRTSSSRSRLAELLLHMEVMGPLITTALWY